MPFLYRKPCTSFESQFSSTISIEWGLVCGQEYKRSIAQSVYFAGQMSGTFYRACHNEWQWTTVLRRVKYSKRRNG